MVQPHIQLDDTLGIPYALLPGDPGRLDRIAPLLEQVRELGFHREYRSLCGSYHGVPVLVISTGMGGCSMGIAVEELKNIGVRTMIRIGSCGALQPDIGVGDLILCNAAVRDDGASRCYVDLQYPAVADTRLLLACMQAAQTVGARHHVGLVHSHESFYHDEAKAVAEQWAGRGVLGADMETAALYTIARLRGVRAMSILNNVVASGTATADAVGDYAGGESCAVRGERLTILTALEALAHQALQDGF